MPIRRIIFAAAALFVIVGAMILTLRPSLPKQFVTLVDGKESESLIAPPKSGDWSNDAQLTWHNQAPERKINYHFSTYQPGTSVQLGLLKAFDYGNYQFYLDGVKLGAPVEYKGIAVSPGNHVLTIECVGKNKASFGHLFGMDYIQTGRGAGKYAVQTFEATEANQIHVSNNGQKVRRQLGSDRTWRNRDHLFWEKGKIGTAIKLSFTSTKPGSGIRLKLTKGPNNGIFQFYFNGKKVSDPVNLYDASVQRNPNVDIDIDVPTGAHELTVKCVGKDKLSKGNNFSIDYLDLTRKGSTSLRIAVF